MLFNELHLKKWVLSWGSPFFHPLFLKIQITNYVSAKKAWLNSKQIAPGKKKTVDKRGHFSKPSQFHRQKPTTSSLAESRTVFSGFAILNRRSLLEKIFGMLSYTKPKKHTSLCGTKMLFWMFWAVRPVDSKEMSSNRHEIFLEIATICCTN